MAEKDETNLVVAEETKPQVFKLSTQAIAVIAENVALAEMLVTSVLERSVDFGRTPGTPTDGLWDPGASKIAAAFNCYPSHEVIFHEESDDLISWTIQAKLISRINQQVIATGMGACSTREPKYRYRWVADPQNYGYTDAEIKDLKTKKRGDFTVHRIENPEYGELVNTLLQMASKRAEVDAAKSLPGVGSALRKLFDPEKKHKMDAEPDYKRFYTIAKSTGLNEDAIHKALGVTSMKEWTGSGRTLDEALEVLFKKMGTLLRKMREAMKAAEGVTPKQETKKEAAPVIEEEAPGILPSEIMEDNLRNTDDLLGLAKQFWHIEEALVFSALGFKDREGYELLSTETPWQSYLKLLNMYHKPEEPPAEETEPIEPDEIPF